MSKNSQTPKKLWLIYGIVMSVLTVAAGVCFIVACVTIYKSGGEDPFTRASIAEQFERIAIPVILFIAGLLTGIVLSFIFPDEKKWKPFPVQKMMLANLRKKAPALDTSKYRKFRTVTAIVTAALCAVFALIPLPYLLDAENYSTESINESIIAATLTALPFVAVGFAVCLVASWLMKKSRKDEIDFIKSELAAKRESGASSDATAANATLADKKSIPSGRVLLALRIALPVVAIVFIVLGVLNGGMNDVLEKAIRICTECIGLG